MQARLPTGLIGALIAGVLGCSSCTPMKAGEATRGAAQGSEPEVSVTPEGDEVASEAQVVLSFADGVPPDVIDTDRGGLRIPLTITPDPGCSWRKLDDRRIACDLKSAGRLALATEYRLSVAPGWQTASGRPSTTTFEHRFRTASPVVVFSYLQGHRSSGEPRFVVFTNTPVSEQSLIEALKITAVTGVALPVQVLPANTPVVTKAARQAQYSVPYDSFDPIRGPLTKDPRYYIVAPGQPLPPGIYQLQVSAGLRARNGSVAGTEKRVLQTFESYGDFAFRGVYCRPDGAKVWVRYAPEGDVTCARGSLQLSFSSAVDIDRLNESTRISGPGFVQGYLRASGADVITKPDPQLAPGREELRWSLYELSYGSTYRIRIDALQDQFGRQLQHPVDISVRVGHQAPSLEVPRDLLVFENDSSADVTIGSVNADAPVLLTWRQMTGEEQQISLPPLARPNDLLHVRRPTGGPLVDNNQWIRGRVASRMLTRWMENLAEDVSVLSPSDEFVAQRTPFNVHWIGGLNSGLIWVTTLKDAQPVEGASVQIFRGELGQAHTGPLASAVTDANGLARIEYRWPAHVPAGGSQSQHYMEVKRGVQRAWLPWSAYASSDCGSCDPAFPRSDAAQYRVIAFPSQPIYDPGELAQVVLIARQLDADSNRPLVRGRYELEFLENNAAIADMPRIPIQWSYFGTAEFTVRLPDQLRSEAITLRLRSTDQQQASSIYAGRLAVSPTQKPLHKVDTLVEQASGGARIKVAANLFAGGPYANAPAQIIARLTPGYLSDTITEYPGFEFSQTVAQVPYSVDLDPAAGSTDGDGQFQHEFAIDAERYYSAQLEYEATVEDPMGRSLADRSGQRLFLRDRFVGIDFASGPYVMGQPAAMRAVIVGPDGKQAKGAVATLQIAYNTARTLRPTPQSWRTLRECTLRSGAAPVSCEFQPVASGYYRVVGSVTDSKGRVQRTEQVRFVELDDQQASMPRYRYNQVKLSAPQAVYVGDTIDVELTADFERSTALVSLLTNRVLDAKVHDLRGGRKKLSIKVTDAMFPAFTVEAAVQVPRLGHLTQEQLRRFGRDTLKPEMYEASQRVYVYERSMEEPLTLSADRKTYAPGETASIRITNQDPLSSIEANLLVVDRSLLSLTDDRTYELDPWQLRTPTAWLSLIKRESLLGYRLRGESAYGFLPLPHQSVLPYPSEGSAALAVGSSVGTDAESSTGTLRNRRSVFRSVALWRSQIVLEPGQSQQVPVQFPDNVGQWSIIALAVDAGHRLQTIRQEVTVTKPLIVAPLLPSQLIAGDQLDAQFSVTNLSTRTVQGTWAQDISGPLQRQDGATAAAFTLQPNQPLLVNLPVAADAAGAALIKFGANVSVGNAQDAIEVGLPIRGAEVIETSVEVGQLQGGRSPRPVSLQLPADAISGSGKLDLYVGRGGADLIAGAIASARNYPHACWEQNLTRAVSAALYLKLQATVDSGFAWPEAEQVISTTLASARRFQADNGGMTFFEPGNQYADAYLTAFTLLAFDWLRQFGYDVPEQTEGRAIEYLLDLNRRHPERLQQWAAALPLLTQRTQIDAPTLERMVAAQPAADVVTRSYMYSAVRHLVEPEPRARLERVLNKELSRGLYFDQGAASLPLLSNEVAQCATISNLLRAEDPRGLRGQIAGQVDGLVRSLQDRARRRSHWSTTHENVFCAKALWDYEQSAQRSGKSAPVEVAAALNGRSMGSVPLAGSQSQQLQLLTLPVGTPGPQQLEIRPTGLGAADYRAVLTYQRSAAAQRAQASGFSLARSYQVRRGKAWVDVDQDTPVEKNSLLRVNLDIVVPTARTLVALQDPIPAGVEILNDLFATTSRAELAAGNEGKADRAQPFEHHVVRRDSMSYYTENLPAGRYRVSYLVRAIAAGEFTALPPRIEEMYRPEVFGSAEVFRLKVRQSAGR